MMSNVSNSSGQSAPRALIDKFGRRVDYIRLSVTDRCDFRCVYCMTEDMTFLPRDQVLSLEELYMIARAFTELGVNKIRLTGESLWCATTSCRWWRTWAVSRG